MGHAINPRTQRAATVKTLETSPKTNVNLLQEIAPQVRVGFVSPCQTLERCRVICRSFLVKIVLG